MSDAPSSPVPTDSPVPEAPEPEPAVPSADLVAPAPRVTAPTQAELDALPADRRLELMDLDRQERHRRLNTWILATGVLATVGTLLATTLTLRSGQDQLNLTREGQVTDRYTKAIEQLGSDKREVRTAAVYALERIAKDSTPDRQAVRDVLAAFVRERDPASDVQDAELPDEPATDIAAALTVLARRPPNPDTDTWADTVSRMDLHATRIPHASLSSADLTGADLTNADLRDAKLTNADLRDADLTGADLTGASLSNAVLFDADLRGVNLHDADLRGADLRGIDLAERDVLAMTGLVEGAQFKLVE